MLDHLETKLNPVGMATFLGQVIDPYLHSRAEGRFLSEGDDAVGKWVPLSHATQAIRAQQGYGSAHPINHRTGELEDYITGTPGAAHPHALGATLTFPGNPPKGELKTKVETAQRGKTSPQTPPRPVLAVNEKDLAFTLGALAAYIKADSF